MIPSEKEMKEAFKSRHGKELQKRFSSATVAVCGLGGLGSNISVSLARAGIGTLILADFDRVDVTNLHRQQYKASQTGMLKTEALYENLKEINPYINIKKVTAKITEKNAEEILKTADIVCEAFDSAENKAMLTDFILEKFPEKYFIAASGMAGKDSPNKIKTRKITEKFYLCGDGISEVSENGGLFAPRVMLCASHQALTVLRILAGDFEI